ncbi:MAG: DUF1588 domain-containing protein, partial [Pseudomonadota bacterium]
QHILDTDASYQDLMLSKTAFIKDPVMAAVYNSDQWNSNGNPVTLNGTQRAGVLTRAAVLASGTDKAAPIHRGVVVRRNVLCDEIPNPNPDDFDDPTQLASPEVSKFESLRTQIERRTSPPQCMVCHSLINPPAFALENFDSLGRFRSYEKVIENGQLIAQHPVDSKVVDPRIELPNEETLMGAAELSESVAASTKGPACMVRRWFTFAEGRAPTSEDNCELNHMYQSLESENPQASVMKMLKSKATSERFRQRKWR